MCENYGLLFGLPGTIIKIKKFDLLLIKRATQVRRLSWCISSNFDWKSLFRCASQHKVAKTH